MRIKAITRRQLLTGIATIFLANLAWAAPYQTPVQTSAIWRGEWKDASRDRSVPVKIYYPTGTGRFPVVVFSHGLGGSREGYEYLGAYWAQHGFVAVHLQHIGSDDSVWKGGGGMAAIRAGMSTQNAVDRARDVSFALDQLEALDKTPAWPLHDRLDLSRIGLAGHSFGANTTLLVSGLTLRNGNLADKRIKCAIALSSPPPRTKNYDTLYGGIQIPMLHMTGTADTSPVDPRGSNPIDRRIPYDHINGADGYLVTFAGGDHMVFSGQRRGEAVASDARNHALIQQATTAFWDAYLNGDGKALAWLRSDFAKEMSVNGVFEQKKRAG